MTSNLHYQDNVDTMLITILDHTFKHARSIQPGDINKGRAFRVLKTAVRDVLQTYRRHYRGECTICILLSVSATAVEIIH